ncbi:hypothetical protein ACOMHN_006609 [Nucella lapillus]
MCRVSFLSIVAIAILITLCEGQLPICQYSRLMIGDTLSVSPKPIGFTMTPSAYVRLNTTVATFNSPAASENISSTQECLLHVDGGGIIQMNVSSFDLGGQDPCNPNTEHLTISFYTYYAYHIRGGKPTITVETNRGYMDTIRWCGRSYSTRLETRQRMIIKYFAGPETQRGSGFTISFSRVSHFTCGHGEEKVGKEPMYIYSPGYPAAYDNNVDQSEHSCNWQLRGRHGQPLWLESERFSLEPHASCNYDFLQIDREKYCGDQRIQLKSTNNVFNIAFFTDSSGQYDGFVLKIVEIPKDVTTCGEHVKASTSPISLRLPSIRPGQFYSVACWRVVDAGSDDHVVLLENTRFHTSASCTEFELRIYDGQNKTRGDLILSSCAPVEMFRTVRSATRHLHIFVDMRVTGTTVTTVDVTYTVTSQHRDAVPPQLYAGFAESLIWLNLSSWDNLGLLVRGSEDTVSNYSTCLHLSLKEFPTRATSLNTIDFLSVYSGWNSSFVELGQACGRTSSELLVSRGSKVYIVFHKYLSPTTIQGVWLTYQLSRYCQPAMVPLSSTSKRTHSFGRDWRNTLCLWLIQAENSTSFVQTSVVRSSGGLGDRDNFTAYDYIVATDTKSELLSWSSSERPRVVVVSSKGNSLLLRYSTNATTGRGIGLTFNYSSVLLVNSDQCPSISVVIAEKKAQYLTSPNYPYNYPNGVDCRWRIKASAGSVVHLALLVVTLFPEGSVCSVADFLVLYDGWYRSGRILADLCGNQTQTPELTSTGKYMLVHFHSNSRGTARGFRLTYQAITDRGGMGCDREVFVTDVEDREITSPYFPQFYPGNTDCFWKVSAPLTQVVMNTDCFWKVSAPLTQVVMLEVMELDLPCTSPVFLYDGPSDSSLMIASLCGDNRHKRQYVSTQKSLYIRFRSTSNGAYTGFRFRLRSWTSIGGCRGDVAHLMAYTNKLSFTSPSYPANYPPNSDCTWRIESAHRDMSVKVQIDDAHLQDSEGCRLDSLTLYDGYGMGSKQLGKYCGTYIKTFVSSETYMFLRFVSDDFIGYKGFRLFYQAVPHPPPGSSVQGGGSAVKINLGAILGGVLGGALFLAFAVAIFVCKFCRRCRHPCSSTSSSSSSSRARERSHRQRAGSTVFVMNPVIVNQMAPPPYPGLTNSSFVDGGGGGGDHPPAYHDATVSFFPLDAPPSYSEVMLESHPPSASASASRGGNSSQGQGHKSSQGQESGGGSDGGGGDGSFPHQPRHAENAPPWREEASSRGLNSLQGEGSSSGPLSRQRQENGCPWRKGSSLERDSSNNSSQSQASSQEALLSHRRRQENAHPSREDSSRGGNSPQGQASHGDPGRRQEDARPLREASSWGGNSPQGQASHGDPGRCQEDARPSREDLRNEGEGDHQSLSSAAADDTAVGGPQAQRQRRQRGGQGDWNPQDRQQQGPRGRPDWRRTTTENIATTTNIAPATTTTNTTTAIATTTIITTTTTTTAVKKLNITSTTISTTSIPTPGNPPTTEFRVARTTTTTTNTTNTSLPTPGNPPTTEFHVARTTTTTTNNNTTLTPSTTQQS